MVVRLAFSVIAHVDADILIIDEALAVGDAFFTQKCMRFLRKFMAEHTVLFVSHDAAAVNNLCNRAILLEDGCVKLEGPPKEVTELYLKDMYESMQGTSAAAAEQGDDVTAAEKRPLTTKTFATCVRNSSTHQTCAMISRCSGSMNTVPALVKKALQLKMSSSQTLRAPRSTGL